MNPRQIVIQINGRECKQFQEALISAFPSTSALKQMVRFELDENLEQIAMGENYSDIVFKLIEWAEAQGKVKELLTAARNLNPGNLELQSFEEQMRDKNDENSQSATNTNSSNRKIAKENNPTPQTIVNPTPIKPKPQIPEDNLSSEKGVDYTRLRDLLKAGKWKEADKETGIVMLKAAGKQPDNYLYSKDIEKFPCTDLRTIDQLWVKYSNGRFGFSVQKRIWESVGKDEDKFGDRVGWRKGMFGTFINKKWVFINDLTFSLEAPEGQLPVTPRLRYSIQNIVSLFSRPDL